MTNRPVRSLEALGLPKTAVWCNHCRSFFPNKGEYEYHALTREYPVWNPLIKTVQVTDIDGRVTEHSAPSVPALESAGFRVIIKYFRYLNKSRVAWNRWNDLIFPPKYSTHGGSCHVILLGDDGIWAEGWSHCSRKDAFSRKTGYVLAVNAALAQYRTRA